MTLSNIFCRSTEHDHVTDNLPTKLFRIRTFGNMKLKEFKDLLSVADYKMCETKMVNGPTWYPLTLDVFVKFLYKVIGFHYFPQSLLPCLCSFLILFLVCSRGRYLQQRITQQGCTVRIIPRLGGRLAKFGMPWQKLKRGSSNPFDLGTLKSIFSSPTRTTVMTSSTRCLSYPTSYIFFLEVLNIFSCLVFISFPFCGRLTVIFPAFSSPTWQLTNSKRWPPLSQPSLAPLY
jgi:hypothetical protein